MVGYKGPWVAGGDATKVSQSLQCPSSTNDLMQLKSLLNSTTSFSEGQGGHIIGSCLPLSETHFVTSEEQQAVMDKIAKGSGLATQVWVLGIKVCTHVTCM